MRSSSDINADIDALDCRVWASLNIDTGEPPSAWLDYTFDEQFALDRAKRDRLCGELTRSLEAGGHIKIDFEFLG